jgi:hypothetical protein
MLRCECERCPTCRRRIRPVTPHPEAVALVHDCPCGMEWGHAEPCEADEVDGWTWVGDDTPAHATTVG